MEVYPLYIGGKFIRTDKRLNVVSPYNGRVVGKAFEAGKLEVEAAIRSSLKAFKQMKALSSLERSSILSRISDGVQKEKKTFIQILVEEAGKPTFGLIDRAGIDGILKELNFQQTGYLSRADQLKIGEILGVTHILFETYSRYPSSGSFEYLDQADFRLIEVNTARVLATDTVINKKYRNEDRWSSWQFKN